MSDVTADAIPNIALSSLEDKAWTRDEKLTITHYGLLLVIYSVYGYQVCPFLETLSPIDLVGTAAAMLLIQFAFRAGMKRAFDPLPLERKVRALFWGDLALFVNSGILLAVYNLFVYGFPLDSGVKIVIAFVSIGFYASLDLALERKYNLARELRATGSAFPTSTRFMPYQGKFIVFSAVNLLILSTICVLVILKDLIWTAETNPDPQLAQIIIMGEVVFVVAVIGAYIMRVIRQYSRNLSQSIAAENNALERVQNGYLDAHVPVTSNDEFGHMADLTNQMIVRLVASREEIERTQDATMTSLITLAAKRDNETGMHIRRTQTYVAMLASTLQETEKYRDVITAEMIDLMYKSAPLHDIGKVGIPDAILQKPGKLDDDEFEIMKTHAQIGAEALEDAERALGRSSFLSLAREIAATHHEKWDGSGYPKGLKGSDIPLSGRLMAIADVYDALRSERVYKPGFSHEKSAKIILEGKGTHFDPDIVDAFETIAPAIERVARTMGDEREEEDGWNMFVESSATRAIRSAI